MKWPIIFILVQFVYSCEKPSTNKDDVSSSSWTYEVKGGTDLLQIDHDISVIYKNPDPHKKQKLMDDIHLYLITLRRFNKMTKKECPETSEQASQLVHSGGPYFLKINAFYSDEEQVLRHKLNFTDLEFQEYQYYRLDTETEWSELKDQIAHLDRDKEKEEEIQKNNV